MGDPIGRTGPLTVSVGGLNLGTTSFRVVPSIDGAVQLPPLAGGLTLDQPDVSLATLQVLAEQQELYGNGEQPPVQVQHQPYMGPPLRYLVSGRQVRYPTHVPQLASGSFMGCCAEPLTCW